MLPLFVVPSLLQFVMHTIYRNPVLGNSRAFSTRLLMNVEAYSVFIQIYQ